MPEQSHNEPLPVTAALIEQYLKGLLDDKTMHAIEKRALEDPLLSDALEGFSLHEPDQQENLADLKRRLSERVGQQRKEKRFFFRRKWWAAAATLLLLVGGFTFYQWQNGRDLLKKQPAIHITGNAFEPAPSAISPDSIHSSGNLAANEKTASDKAANNLVANSDSPAGKKPLQAARKKTPEKNEPPAVASTRPAAPLPKDSSEKVVVVAFASGKRNELTGSTLRKKMPAQPATNFPKNRPRAMMNESRQKAVVSPNTIWEGKVSDAESGQPIRGATITVPGTEKATISDSAGRFYLQSATAPESLSVAFIGYQSFKSQAPFSDASILDVALHPSSAKLNEVVVVGYDAKQKNASILDAASHPSSAALNEVVVVGYDAKQKKENSRAPAPINGFPSFRQYLRDSLHYPAEALKHKVEGVVKISFKVMPNGSLQDFRITKSPGHGCNEEAIRLIESGPAWQPATDGKPARVKVTIPFKLPDDSIKNAE